MADQAHAPKHARDIFTKPVLDRIAKVIGEIERTITAEIRVSLKDERDHDDAGITTEEMAKREFIRLDMQKTNGRNAILLFILYEERKFYVYGDTGIHDRVHPETWEDVAASLKEHFKHGRFEEGVIESLRKILNHLHTAFASSSNEGKNELSNEVIVR